MQPITEVKLHNVNQYIKEHQMQGGEEVDAKTWIAKKEIARWMPD